MTGRHRRTATTATRRALVAGVPALGLVGAVTALTGAEPTTTPGPVASGSAEPATRPSAPLAAGPAVTTVASDAARAAGRAGERQREEERRALDDVVDDVRTDAQVREAAAAAQGREQLDSFQQELQRLRPEEPDPGETADRRSSVPDVGGDEGCDTGRSPDVGDHRADPGEIVGRDCGLVDMFGRQRSNDPWIDGQLLSAVGE